jgi:hypothetical protein
VRIRRRLAEQGRARSAAPLPPKDYSKKLKPGKLDLRERALGHEKAATPKPDGPTGSAS